MFILSSPITIKELRPLLRSRKAFWLTLLVLLISGGGIVLVAAKLGSGISSLSERAMFGRVIFMGYSLFMLCALGLISPIVTSTAITAEREANTLELLVSTGLSRRRILLGKLAASLTWQLLIVILTLPILALPLQLGGVGLDEVLFAALMITLTAVVYGMVGLAVSSIIRKSVAALVVTLILVLLPTFEIPVMDILGHNGFMRNYREMTYSFSPPVTLVMSSEKRILQSINQPGTQAASLSPIQGLFEFLATPAVLDHLAFQAVFFLVAWLLALRGLNRRKSAERVAVARKVIHDPAVLERRRKRWPYYLIDPLRSEQVIADGHNPVYVKERRIGILSRPDPLIRCCYVGAFVSLLFCINNIAASEVVPLPALALWMIIPLGLFCLTQGAASIAREREAQTLELLTSTPLAPSQIVRAKFRAIMRFVFFITLSLLAVPALTMPIFYGTTLLTRQAFKLDMDLFFHTFKTLIQAMIFTLVYCSFYTTLGIYCSTRSRRALPAIVGSFMLACALALIPVVCMSFYQDTYYLQWVGFMPVSIIEIMVSPFYLFLGGAIHSPLGQILAEWQHRWGYALSLCVMILGLATILLRLAAGRLARKART